MSSKAPPKAKNSASKQSSGKSRKSSSTSTGAGARTKTSARSRAASGKTAAAAGGTRRPSTRRASEQPQVPEDDAVKPEAAAGRSKGARAAKDAKGAAGAKARRSGKAGTAHKSAGAADARRRKKVPTRVNGFAVGDHVVYPAHGVGRITGIDERAVADQTLQMFVVAFEKDKMTLLVPTNKVDSAGMRRLSSRETMDAAISTLRGRARTRRVMWSRRAQEYEAKLNSGDPVAIAEVVRDLHRNVGQPDQSYSERQMYEAALDRLAREFAAVDNTDTEQAATKLEDVLRAA